jgi:hypothetical protein
MTQLTENLTVWELWYFKAVNQLSWRAFSSSYSLYNCYSPDQRVWYQGPVSILVFYRFYLIQWNLSKQNLRWTSVGTLISWSADRKFTGPRRSHNLWTINKMLDKWINDTVNRKLMNIFFQVFLIKMVFSPLFLWVVFHPPLFTTASCACSCLMEKLYNSYVYLDILW